MRIMGKIKLILGKKNKILTDSIKTIPIKINCIFLFDSFRLNKNIIRETMITNNDKTRAADLMI